MKQNRTHGRGYGKRLARIERKCDAILSLLASRKEDAEIDRAISLMHRQARKMKEQAASEERFFRETFSSSKPRR